MTDSSFYKNAIAIRLFALKIIQRVSININISNYKNVNEISKALYYLLLLVISSI